MTVSPWPSAEALLAPFPIEATAAKVGAFFFSLEEHEASTFEDAWRVLKAVRSGEVPEKIPASLQERGGDAWAFSTVPIALHQELMKSFYFGRATKTFARAVKDHVGDGLVLEVMAGRGFLTKALREAGVKVHPTDLEPKSPLIEALSAEDAVRRYGAEASLVVMSWPWGGDLEAARALWEVNPLCSLLLIGEEEGGCTGTEEFWRHWAPVEAHALQEAYATTVALHDRVHLGRYTPEEREDPLQDW